MLGARPFLGVIAVALLGGPLLAPPLAAQGRRGWEWQTEQQLAREGLKQLEAELARLSEDEWREKALAWISVVFPSEGRLLIEESYAVAAVDAGKKATVEEAIPGGSPSWTVSYPKKVPKQLTLTLTDPDRTRVPCRLADAAKTARRFYLGVFLQELALHCRPRVREPGFDG